MFACVMSATLPAPSCFLSCDWGTTAFRLRLVEIPGLKILAESRDSQGISSTYSAWQAAGSNESARWDFFLGVISLHLLEIEKQAGRPVENIPLILSGMASSTIGCRELPYKEMPFAIDGSELQVETVAAHPGFPHEIALISGARTHRDIMRGEETQLVGALAGVARTKAIRTVILPGTHSKHIKVENGQATDLRTYMTGEFFDLLSKKSVLSASVETNGDLDDAQNATAFDAGVRAGAGGNLLNRAFGVRVRGVLEKTSKSANYHYLSGMLIGSELGSIPGTTDSLTLIAGGALADCYRRAFGILQPAAVIDTIDVNTALLKGQWGVASNLGLLREKN